MQKWWVTNGATVEIFHHQSQIVTFHWHEIKVLVEREVWNFEVPYLCLSAFSVKWQQMTALGRAAGIKEKRKHLTPSVDWCPFTGSDLVYVATSSLHVQYWPGWGFFFLSVLIQLPHQGLDEQHHLTQEKQSDLPVFFHSWRNLRLSR